MNPGGRQTRRDSGLRRRAPGQHGGRRERGHSIPGDTGISSQLRRPHVTGGARPGKRHTGVLSVRMPRHTRHGDRRGLGACEADAESRRAAGGPGRRAQTRRPRSCRRGARSLRPSLPAPRPRSPGPLTPRSGAHGRCPAPALRPRPRGAQAGPRAAGIGSALAATRATHEVSTSTAPPAPAARRARAGGGGWPSGREATEEGRRTGSGSDPATHPAVVCAIATSAPASTRHHHGDPWPFALFPPPRADRGQRSKSLAGTHRFQTTARGGLDFGPCHRRRCLWRLILGPPGQPAARPPPLPAVCWASSPPLLPGPRPARPSAAGHCGGRPGCAKGRAPAGVDSLSTSQSWASAWGLKNPIEIKSHMTG